MTMGMIGEGSKSQGKHALLECIYARHGFVYLHRCFYKFRDKLIVFIAKLWQSRNHTGKLGKNALP